jgi:hypothetical protein
MTKKLLYTTLDLVTDKEIRFFYNQALDNAPELFWKAPASTSGKYHAPESNKESGLANAHTLKAVFIAHTLAEHEYFLLPVEEKNRLRDIIVVAAGCHDMKKGGENWEIYEKNGQTRYTYDKRHGIVAAEWLKQFDLRNPEKEMIIQSVYYHMNWLHPDDEERKEALCPERPTYMRIVQYADAMAARKWASFLPGVPISEKVIENYDENSVKKTIEVLWIRKE